MTNNIYAPTLKTVVNLLDMLEEFTEEIEDAGISLEYINVLAHDGEELVGQIQFDGDRHPYFSPEF